jgi:hypothetical protein
MPAPAPFAVTVDAEVAIQPAPALDVAGLWSIKKPRTEEVAGLSFGIQITCELCELFCARLLSAKASHLQ